MLIRVLHDGLEPSHHQVLEAIPADIDLDDGWGLDLSRPGDDRRTLVFRGAADPRQLIGLMRAEFNRDFGSVSLHADPKVVDAEHDCAGDGAVGDVATLRERLGLDDLASAGATGRDAYIAIVDTGFNPKLAKEYESRFSLSGLSVSPSLSFCAGNNPKKRCAGFEIGNQAPKTTDAGHGTQMSALAQLAAPDATLINAQALCFKGSGESDRLSNVLTAIVGVEERLESIRKEAPRSRLIVNLSLAIEDHEDQYVDDPDHPFDEKLQRLSETADVVCAAGNCAFYCGDCCLENPRRSVGGFGAIPSVLTVSGVDVEDAVLNYSASGGVDEGVSKPDVCCYAHFGSYGKRQKDPVVHYGTSVSTALTSGVLAAIGSTPAARALTPSEFHDLVRTTCRQLDDGHCRRRGWGVIDPLRLLAAVTNGD